MDIVQNVLQTRTNSQFCPSQPSCIQLPSDCFCYYVPGQHTFKEAKETYLNYSTFSLEISAYFKLKLGAKKVSLYLYDTKLREIVFAKVKESGELVLPRELT